jgi:hypothetical protein
MQNFDLTNVCNIELHIRLLGLVFFFSQLVFELLLIHSRRLTDLLLMVYFGTPNMFITLWFGFDYGTNPPLGTLII